MPQVQAEIELIARAVEHDVPVLGLCFGGQVLAHVLGGTIEAAPTPEFGWHEIETDEPDAIPAGPWLLWHYQRFTVPPGATEVARTERRHAGLPPRPAPRPAVPPREHHRDRRRLGAQGRGEARGPSASRTARRSSTAPDERKDAAKQAAFRLFDAFSRRERMIEERGLMARPPELSDQSVTSVRVLYPDLHGVARGKDVPIGEFDRAAEHGLASARRSWAPTCATRRSSAARRATPT